YRDVEVDRTHPLAATLAELRRAAAFNRVLLRGLDVEGVRRMVAAVAQGTAADALVEAVHQQTEGNPLFVQEVVRYLAEEGQFQRTPAPTAAGDAAPRSGRQLLTQIPEGVREVIGKRLSRLSAAANSVLGA